MRVRLVIPAFNEAARLPLFLEFLAKEIAASDLSVEVQVVDDGSESSQSCEMAQAVDRVRKKFSFVLPIMRLEQNRGKGGAIRAGWENTGEVRWLAFVDADGATSAKEIVRVIGKHLRQSRTEAVFASRIKILGRKIDRKWSRHVVGRVFATLVSNLLQIDVYDSQCGFKLIPVEAYRKIEPHLRESGFCLDVELLLYLQAAGAEVIEVPVDWADIAGSKVRLIRDSWRMFWSILEIKKRIKSFQ